MTTAHIDALDEFAEERRVGDLRDDLVESARPPDQNTFPAIFV